MPSALVEFTTVAGGGADPVAATTCTLAGGRATASTAALPASTATGVMATRGKAGAGAGTGRATLLAAQASTKELSAATLNAESHVILITHWRHVARWRWLNLQPATAFGDLHTKAGSSVCGLRR